MLIDKQNTNIAFNNEHHLYWNTDTKEKYTSVTSLIKKYTKPFDVDFFSKYKAIKQIKDSSFVNFKKQCGGFKNVVSFFESNIDKKDLQLYKDTQNYILDKWSKESKEASEKGTNFHKEKEVFLLKKKEITYNNELFLVSQNVDLHKKGNFVYPEYLLFDHYFKVSGQIDLLYRKNDSIILEDYKTNKEIKKNNPFQNMLYPLEYLQDCNYNHYCLQLSLYAYLLEKNYSLKIKKLYLKHINIDLNTEVKIQCPYLKKESILVLEDHIKCLQN